MEDLLKRSLQTIKTLKENAQAAKEPIAIVGMACRFPGGCSSPEKFWDFLRNKGDGVRDVPFERWDIEEFYDPEPGKPGKMYLRQANFLEEDVSKFDARFFRISPLEAAEMDPQQRILLELSWEALERAGQNVEGLRGSKTGVFIGIIGSDYSRLPRDPSKVNPYRGTGSIPSIASGRVAHVLGFHGPALSVDTTCSSSLVSLQLACDSLHKGKCDTALAGGVNMMLSPNPMIPLCMMNALAADGRCRPFDGDGQGYGRAEGAGLVVLKRLSKAIEDNDPVLAVIRSTAVNQDGPSSGLTVPNGNAQRELILEALRDAGLEGRDVNYLEAHGTGTSLGDPIEVRAIKEALGQDRGADNPLTIGSVKGNVGHLEGAAGVCGLIKAVLCLQHKQIPANVNLATLNPRLPLEQIPAEIPPELADWRPTGGRPRVAGVSSFGFSGTNAHAILAEAPERLRTGALPADPPPLSVMKLSAKTEWALTELLRSYAEHLAANPDLDIRDVCYTANACRSDFPLRLAFVARDTRDLRAQIESALNERVEAGEQAGGKAEADGPAKIVFLFKGDGQKLSRGLHDRAPRYRRHLDRCEAVLESRVGRPLKGLIFGGGDSGLKATPLAVSAALFAQGYALAMFLNLLGVRPAAVWAESKEGGLAAACAAGILSLEDAAALIADPASAELKSLQPPRCRVLDPASGRPLKKSQAMNPAYWRELTVSPADGSGVVAALSGQDYRCLLALGEDGSAAAGEGAKAVGVRDDWQGFLNALATLYRAGVDVDWAALDEGDSAAPEKILLPTYPFERRRYWSPLKPTAATPGEQVGAASKPSSAASSGNPLQGEPVRSPLMGERFEHAYRLSLANLPEAKDTHGIVHVGYYQEMLKRAVRDSFDREAYTVEDKRFLSALILTEAEADVRLVLEPSGDGATAFRFFSQSEDGAGWECHVEGRLALGEEAPGAAYPLQSLDAAKDRSTEHFSGEEFYEKLRQRSVNLGPAVQWVEEVWRSSGEALVRFKAHSPVHAKPHALGFHPGVLDACAQIFHAALFDEAPADAKFMVVRWQGFAYQGPPEDDTLWCHVLLERDGAPRGSIVGSFDLFDASGRLVASAASAEMKQLKGFNVRQLKKMREDARVQAGEADAGLLREIAAASGKDKEAVLAARLREATAEVLGIPVEDIRPGDTLIELGIDSMSGVMLQAAIARDLGSEPPLDAIIQGPSLAELAHRLLEDLPQNEASAVRSSAEAERSAPAPSAGTPLDREAWFARTKPAPGARVRLFCLPYGGGGASIYAQWRGVLGEGVDVRPIQLPHRENRLREPAITDIGAMVDRLAEAVEPELDLPCAFYGHSMGALLAYRLAHRLWQGSSARQVHLFVGGFSAPSIHPNPLLARTSARLAAIGFDGIPDAAEVKAMPEEMLKSFAASFGGFQRIPEAEKELRELLLPIFVGDLALVRSYEPKPEPVFEVPITAFQGQGDTEVLREETAAWEGLTRGPFALHELPGDHLFLQKDQSQALLLELIGRQLALTVSLAQAAAE